MLYIDFESIYNFCTVSLFHSKSFAVQVFVCLASSIVSCSLLWPPAWTRIRSLSLYYCGCSTHFTVSTTWLEEVVEGPLTSCLVLVFTSCFNWLLDRQSMVRRRTASFCRSSRYISLVCFDRTVLSQKTCSSCARDCFWSTQSSCLGSSSQYVARVFEFRYHQCFYTLD